MDQQPLIEHHHHHHQDNSETIPLPTTRQELELLYSPVEGSFQTLRAVQEAQHPSSPEEVQQQQDKRIDLYKRIRALDPSTHALIYETHDIEHDDGKTERHKIPIGTVLIHSNAIIYLGREEGVIISEPSLSKYEKVYGDMWDRSKSRIHRDSSQLDTQSYDLMEDFRLLEELDATLLRPSSHITLPAMVHDGFMMADTHPEFHAKVETIITTLENQSRSST
jgi:hypothetical protein